MAIKKQFSIKYDKNGTGLTSNIIERDESKTILRVFPVDDYTLPEEIKRKAKEWHVLMVPLLGQRITDEEAEDWCGRTSCSMIYNYFQFIKGGDRSKHYITHSRASNPACKLDLRYPGGERAFFSVLQEDKPLKGWNQYPIGAYEVGGQGRVEPRGEIPLPLPQILAPGPQRPTGAVGVLRYSSTPGTADAGNLLSSKDRARADQIMGDEKAVQAKFAHLIECLRANNPVLIYTGLAVASSKSDPRHIIVISGYCILNVEGEDQLWLVTADPSPKGKLVNKKILFTPNPDRNGVDLGHPLTRKHTLFRIISGYVKDSLIPMQFFASFNLVRASALLGRNPETSNKVCNRLLDHAQTPGGVYVYREIRTEVPEDAVDSSFNRPKYSFPLSGKSSTSHPWQYYHNNESLKTGAGGYYLLGMQRNLHGGAHLFPPEPDKSAAVRAIAPGHIVAARLPGPGTPSTQPEVLKALQSWPGFVLVRHEVEALPPATGTVTTGGAVRRGTFYSLSMHLCSPAFPKTCPEPPAVPELPPKEPYLDVPWFRELFKRRFGAWVCLEEDQGVQPGTIVWAQEAFAPNKKSYKVLADASTLLEIQPRSAQGAVRWVYKAPPLAHAEALQALATGKVVTFAEPFFPVATGETLGFVGPMQEPKAPGVLHCQVFSPVDETHNGIRLLTDLAKQLETHQGSAPEFIELRENSPDNFLELEEFQKYLLQTLPSEDRASFKKETDGPFAKAKEQSSPDFSYAESAAKFLDSKTSFAPQAASPDWNSCERFEYPLKLEVEMVHLIPPQQNTLVKGGSYELELGFEREVNGEWQRITCSKGGCANCKTQPLKIDEAKLKSAQNGVLDFSLMVPALAERMTLKARQGFCIEQTFALSGADAALLAQGITRRWRNARLVQLNEWTLASVRGLVSKLNQVYADDIDLDVKHLEPFAWCDPDKEVHVPRVRVDGTVQSTPLFAPKGALSHTSLLDNLHPVSAVWLLNVLDKQNKARVRDDWSVPGFRQEDPSPLDFGWVKQAGERLVGDALTVAVIDEDFGYDKENRVQLHVKQGPHTLPLTAGQEFDAGGNIVQAVSASFWGDWTLELTDTATPPRALLPKKPLGIFSSSVSIARPKLVQEQQEGTRAVIERPRRHADGSFRWLLHFEKPAPRSLAGFVLLLISESKEGPGQPHSQAVLPVMAHPFLNTLDFQVDGALFALEDEFFVGLTEPGRTQHNKLKAGFWIIPSLVAYETCLNARDMHVGWGLIQGLARLVEKKVIFELTRIEPDGLTCSFTTKTGPKVLEVLSEENITLPSPDKNKRYTFTVTFASARCEDEHQKGLWRFDKDDEFVRSRATASSNGKLGGYDYGKYQTACRTGQPLRMHVALAAALAQVALQNNKQLPPLVSLDLDGLSCVLDVGKKGVEDKVRAAVTTGACELSVADPTNKKHLRLSANPQTPDWLAVSFHPGRLFGQLVQSGIQPGKTIYYWFELMALNGQGLLEHFGGESTGEGDGALTLETVEALAAKASRHIRARHEEPGELRVVGFSRPKMVFQLEPSIGSCALRLSACVSGAPEDLARYIGRLTYQPQGGADWKTLAPQYAKIKPENLQLREPGVADWHILAKMPFSQKEASVERYQFKLELVATQPDCVPQRLEMTSGFDFTPRWEGPLKVTMQELFGTQVLELRCHTEGVEIPVAGSKDSRAWKVAREFELLISPDNSKGPEDKERMPSKQVRYAVPALKEKRGGCDAQGDFVATLELNQLDPKRQYTFTVRRPLLGGKRLPVRNTDMGESTTDFTPE